MCKYCTKPIGNDIDMEQSPDSKETQPNKAKIVQSKDNKPGIVLYRHGLAQGCFDIGYCPMCGRKLTENNITIDEELKNLVLRISHKDGELTPNDILSTIKVLLETGTDKNILLKCDNEAELRAVGVYMNIKNNK